MVWSSLVSQGVTLLDQLLQARRAGSNQLAGLVPVLEHHEGRHGLNADLLALNQAYNDQGKNRGNHIVDDAGPGASAP